MPKFQVSDQNTGKKYVITAPDQATAISAFQSFSGAKPAAQYPTNAQGQIDTGNPMAQGAPSAPDPNAPPLADQLSAGFTAGVNAIPIAGPTILGGLERLKGMVQGRPYQDVAASDQAQVQQNPVAAGIGTVTGTVLPFMAGGTIPGVARALGMAGSIPSRVLLGGLTGSLINGTDTAVRGGSPTDVLGAAGIGAGLGGALPLAERGVGMLAGKFLGKPGIPKSVQNIYRAMKDDGITPANVNQQIAQMGDGAMLMDLGPNLQRQAGALASVPGPGQTVVRQAVADRSASATARVTNDVAKTIGTGPDLEAMKQQIVTAQKAAATPLYDAVRDVPVPMQGNIKFVAQTPMGQKAFGQALTMAKNDGYGFQNGPTIGMIDYAKQALDDMAASAARAGRNNEARQASHLARLLRTEADKVAPGYKAARDAFAGPAQVLDAVDAGTTVFTKGTTPTQLAASLNSMSASEKDAFIQGARSYIESQMGNAVNDALSLRNMFKKDWNEQKLRLILGSKVADDLLARISREATFGKTAGVVAGNSETAARQAAQPEVAPELGRVPRTNVTWTGLLLNAFDQARNALHGMRQPVINSQMAGALTSDTLSPQMMKQIFAASKGQRPSLLAPAVPGLLTNPKRPLQITVHGGS